MKTATIPSLRVDPELRRAAEDLLKEGESLSNFVEQSLRDGIQKRRIQGEFLARGLIARDNAKQSDNYVSAETVVDRLESMLANAKAAAESQ